MPGRGGGGALPYGRDGDARRKFLIYPLKATNLDVAEAHADPKRDFVLFESSKYKESEFFLSCYFFVCNPKRDLDG